MTAAEVAVALHVADDRLDGGATAELAFDDADDTALLAGDEDAARAFGLVAAIALVDIGALDGATGELLGRLDDASECVSVIRIAGQRPGVEHEQVARGSAVGDDNRSLDAELVRR